jgi:hypothetical protein
MNQPIEIFFSYAHEDEDLMHDVRRQFVIHERNGRIIKWYDREIPPGAEWRKTIDAGLNRAQIILLFVSPHFIESRYCYEIEGRTALRRHREGKAHVMIVILRPCAWSEAPFSKLQVLPRDAKPVSRWSDRDEACLNVADGVMSVVDEIIVKQRTKGAVKRKATAKKAAMKTLAAKKTPAKSRPERALQPGRRRAQRPKSRKRTRSPRG